MRKVPSISGYAVIYIYVCENVAHNLCCQWKSQSHSPAHVLMRLYRMETRSFVSKAKERGDVRISNNHSLTLSTILYWILELFRQSDIFAFSFYYLLQVYDN